MAMAAMDLQLDKEDFLPRGWSMKHGHRKRLALARDDAQRCWGRSIVKRSVHAGSRKWEKCEEKNKSHKQRELCWHEMRYEADEMMNMEEEDELCYSECEDELLTPWADAWEDDSSETASTAASTVEVRKVEQRKGKAAAWNLAVQQAAMNAKQFQAARDERRSAAAREAAAVRTARAQLDPEVQSLSQRLQQEHRIKLLCPELASRQHNAFEAFRMKFLEDFGSSIGAGLQSCYQGDVELRCAPMNKNLQSRFLSCKEKQAEQLCPVLHGTEDRNLPSIYQKGLLVPTTQNNVRVLNGSSHGRGIYTAKTKNTALSFGFSKGLSRALLICGALDDAVPLPAPVRCGNHFITAESASVRHVGDAIVVFDESKLLPLFVASAPGITPPLQPGPAPAPVPAPAPAPAPAVAKPAVQAVQAQEKCRSRDRGPLTRLPKTAASASPAMAFLSRRGARKRRP